MSNKFETRPSSEKSKEFEQLSQILGNKSFVTGKSDKGDVYIDKLENGSIEVEVNVLNFIVSENGDVEVSMVPDNTPDLQKFSLSDVLSSFEKGDEIISTREDYQVILDMVNKAIERGPGPEDDKHDYERHKVKEGLERAKKRIESQLRELE